MTFEVGKTYQSAVQGVKFRVKMKFRVQDTDCLLVYRLTPSTVFGRTSQYYPALIDDEKTAVVLLEEGFTTIYAEDEE